MTAARVNKSDQGGWWSAVALLVGYSVAVIALMHALDRTADESTYLMAGRAILNEGWEHPLTRLHGPLPFLANQVFAPELTAEILDERLPFDVITRGRLGMLPFGIAAGLLVFAIARRIHGKAGGLLALALFVLNPLMLGYGALMAVDMAYTAGVLLALWLAGRFVERASLSRGVAAGVGLGVACATKYLAVFCVPVVLAAVAFGAARAVAPAALVRAALRGLAAAAGVALVSLLTLHASYGFRAGTAPTQREAYASESVGSLAALPVLGRVITLLPEPYLVGADFQVAVGGGRHRPYLEGEFSDGHWDYYLRVFQRKTPEWTLALFAVALSAWLLRGARVRTGAGRVALALGLPTALGLFVYLSFFTPLQLGVRYVLPLYPLAFIASGAVGDVLPKGRALPLVLAALALLWTSWDLGTQWPNWISYYNASSGGARDGWRHFSDSNTEWGQHWVVGRQWLEENEGADWTWLARDEGPRLGRLVIHLEDLCRADPEDPDRARHWLHAFEPVAQAGQAWFVFDVDSTAWREGLERDGLGAATERGWAEFALALAGAGRFEEARAALSNAGAERAAKLRDLVERGDSAAALDAEGVYGLANLWMAHGRSDVAERLLREHPALPADHVRRRAVARAVSRQRRTAEAVELYKEADLTGATEDVLLLVSLYRELRDLPAGLAALERWGPSLGPEAAGALESARVRLEQELEAQESLRRMVARPSNPLPPHPGE